MGANGTLVWFYKICKREVWLMSKNILPDQMDENIDLGKFIHENSYQRKEKEVLFGNVKFDVVFENEDKLVIGETKKTSKYENASKYQLAYYLFVLKDSGINAEGVLLYPEEKKRTKVILTKELEEELKDIIKEIEEIQEKDIPPELKKINFCKNCGYREYCYS